MPRYAEHLGQAVVLISFLSQLLWVVEITAVSDLNEVNLVLILHLSQADVEEVWAHFPPEMGGGPLRSKPVGKARAMDLGGQGICLARVHDTVVEVARVSFENGLMEKLHCSVVPSDVLSPHVWVPAATKHVARAILPSVTDGAGSIQGGGAIPGSFLSMGHFTCPEGPPPEFEQIALGGAPNGLAGPPEVAVSSGSPTPRRSARAP